MKHFLKQLSLVLFVVIALTTNSLYAQHKTEQQILDVLEAQDAAWNSGDLVGFMETYWNNDSLMFIGKSGVTYGWSNTLKNYQRGYPDTAAMGKLKFTMIRIEKLSRKKYFIVGKWQLTRTAGNLQGHFTLLLRKINGQWKIVVDHSS
jgi:ketosteroid isomerase-like protein